MRLTHRIGLKTLKTKLQCSPCEPTKAHTATKEFDMSLFIGLLQVYTRIGYKAKANLQQILENCSINPDENLSRAAKIDQISAIFRHYKQE